MCISILVQEKKNTFKFSLFVILKALMCPPTCLHGSLQVLRTESKRPQTVWIVNYQPFIENALARCTVLMRPTRSSPSIVAIIVDNVLGNSDSTEGQNAF